MPQIDCLGKMSPVLRVSTSIYAVAKKIDGKKHSFENKSKHVTPQIDCLVKMRPVLRASAHFWGVSKEIDEKTIILSINLVM